MTEKWGSHTLDLNYYFAELVHIFSATQFMIGVSCRWVAMAVLSESNFLVSISGMASLLRALSCDHRSYKIWVATSSKSMQSIKPRFQEPRQLQATVCSWKYPFVLAREYRLKIVDICFLVGPIYCAVVIPFIMLNQPLSRRKHNRLSLLELKKGYTLPRQRLVTNFASDESFGLGIWRIEGFHVTIPVGPRGLLATYRHSKKIICHFDLVSEDYLRPNSSLNLCCRYVSERRMQHHILQHYRNTMPFLTPA
jgi:hypothetical protein